MDESFKPMMGDTSTKEKVFHELLYKEENHNETLKTPEKEQSNKVEMIAPEALSALKTQAYDEGYQLGMKEALESIKEKKQQLNDLINLALVPVSLIDEEVQAEVIKLSAWIAKSMLHSELTIEPQKIMVIFKEIKALLPNVNQMRTLYLSPEDHQIILTLFNEETFGFSIDKLQCEATLSRGEYRFETKSCELNATVESRLQELVLTTLTAQGAHDE